MPINCFTDDCKNLNKAGFDLRFLVIIATATKPKIIVMVHNIPNYLFFNYINDKLEIRSVHTYNNNIY